MNQSKDEIMQLPESNLMSARVVVEDAQPPVVCLGAAGVPSGMALILSDNARAKSFRAANS